MTGRTRTRLDRVRPSVGIDQLALQQIEDDLNADDVDAPAAPGTPTNTPPPSAPRAPTSTS